MQVSIMPSVTLDCIYIASEGWFVGGDQKLSTWNLKGLVLPEAVNKFDAVIVR